MPKCFQSRFRSKQRGLVPEFQVILIVLEFLLVVFPFLSFLDMVFVLYWKRARKEQTDTQSMWDRDWMSEFHPKCRPFNLLHIFLVLSSYLWVTKHIWKRANVSHAGWTYCPKWDRPSSSNMGHSAVIGREAPRLVGCESPVEPCEGHRCLDLPPESLLNRCGVGPRNLCFMTACKRFWWSNSGTTGPSQAPHFQAGTPQFLPPHCSQRSLVNRQITSY